MESCSRVQSISGKNHSKEEIVSNGTVEVPSVVDALTAVKIAVNENRVTPEQILTFIGKRKVRGRRVPDLPSFTFPDSGYTVKVRKVGPWTVDQIRQGLRQLRKEPPVPIMDVEDGEYPNGQPRYRKEANPADPEYKAAVDEYNQWLAEKAGYRLLDIIVSSCIIVDPEDVDPDEVVTYRLGLVRAGPQAEDGEEAAALHLKKIQAMSDEEVFVRCICMSTSRDTSELQKFVTSRSMPTPEAIDEQIATFQPDVQGEATLRGDNNPVGLPI